MRTTALVCLAAILTSVAYAQSDARFTVTAFKVEGAPQPDAATLNRILTPFTGADRSIADLQAARDALEAELRREGHAFIAVQLPPQTLSRGGDVVLKVIEYKVGRVSVEGAQHHDDDNVRRSLPALREGAVPNIGALDAQLQVTNESPVKRTTVVMQPGLSETVDFAVRVEDVRPWRIATTLDNTGTVDTGELRFGIGFQHANLWNRDHIFSFQYVTAPHDDDDPDNLAFPIEDDVQIFGASYRIPLPAARGAVELYGGSANVDSGVVAGVFDITGSGTVLGGRFEYRLPTHPIWEQRLVAGYETRDYDNDVELGGGSEQLVPDYRVNPLSLGYQVQAQFSESVASGGLTLVQNIPGGSNSSSAEFDAVRAGATNQYTLARFFAAAQIPLGRGGEFAMRFDGQYTDDLLVPGEQFGIGGVGSVRGLEQREFIVDRGVSATVEWLSPNLFHKLPSTTTRFVVFLDGAWGDTIDPTPFELSSIDVASVGAGVRIGNGRNIAFRVDYGYLIDPDPDLDAESGQWHGAFTWFF
jgi:hemolysin activation/secretion protein